MTAAILLRVIVLRPVEGVTLAVQHKDGSLQPPSGRGLRSVWFDVEARQNPRMQAHDLLGDAVHGPRGGRFIYVNVGRLAGQPDSSWQRRAKVPLGGIPAALLREAATKGGVLIAAAIDGAGADGTPACATVPLASAWRLVRQSPRGGAKPAVRA